jgi:hypothetical protein
MAILARRLRQRLGMTSMFMLSGLVGTLCGSGWGAPALASDTIVLFPPQIEFISNGKYKGTLQTRGMTLPITGTLEYLSGETDYLHVSVDTGIQRISSDSWVTGTATVIPTVINEWETVSTEPTACRKEVLSGGSYPQCTAWKRTPSNAYALECTVTAQGSKAILDFMAVLSNDNKLIQWQEIYRREIFHRVMIDSVTINMTEQGTTPPALSVFDLPSICNAPNRNEVGQCTDTIPSICL